MKRRAFIQIVLGATAILLAPKLPIFPKNKLIIPKHYKTWYVDPEYGSDWNSGLSPSSPRKNIGRIILSPGDAIIVLLKYKVFWG